MLLIILALIIFQIIITTHSQKCSQDQCLPGSICVNSECVHIKCYTDRQCSDGQKCLPLSFGLSLGREKYCQLSSSNQNEVLNELSYNSQSCCMHNDCKEDEKCIFYNENLYPYSPSCRKKGNQHGYCRKVYGICKNSCECGMNSICVNDKSGSKISYSDNKGFCICNSLDQSSCGRKCELNDDCESSCEMCLHHQCVKTPGINKCEKQQEKCTPSTFDQCKMGFSRKCCSNCDCVSKCLGSQCSCSGRCTGPVPWFCKNKKPMDRNYCSRSRLNEHCEHQNCCLSSLCTPFHLCPSNETLAEKESEVLVKVPEKNPFPFENCFHKGFEIEAKKENFKCDLSLTNVHDCQTLCQNTEGCSYFTWKKNSMICNLYNQKDVSYLKKSSDKETISGYRYCPKNWNQLIPCEKFTTNCFKLDSVSDDSQCTIGDNDKSQTSSNINDLSLYMTKDDFGVEIKDLMNKILASIKDEWDASMQSMKDKIAKALKSYELLKDSISDLKSKVEDGSLNGKNNFKILKELPIFDCFISKSISSSGILSYDGCDIDETNGSMNIRTGTFIVPYDGVYQFTFTGKFGVKFGLPAMGAWVEIKVDDKTIMDIQKGPSSQYLTFSSHTIFFYAKLKSGQKVYAFFNKDLGDNQLYSDNEHDSRFTGRLVYAN